MEIVYDISEDGLKAYRIYTAPTEELKNELLSIINDVPEVVKQRFNERKANLGYTMDILVEDISD